MMQVENRSSADATTMSNDILLQIALSSASGFAAISLDAAGNITDWNIDAIKMFGYEQSEIDNKHFSFLFTREYAINNRPSPNLQAGLDKGHAEFNGWLMKKDGARFWARCLTVPLIIESQHVQGFRTIILDRSESGRVEALVQLAREYAEQIVATVREPLLVLDKQLRVVSANRSFYETFEVVKEETENQLVFKLGDGQWDSPKLRHLLEDILPQDSYFEDLEITYDFPHIGQHTLLLNARKLYNVWGHTDMVLPEMILLAMEDITLRKEVEVERAALLAREQAARHVAEAAVRARNELLATVAHDLKTPLTTIKGRAQVLLRSLRNDSTQTREMTGLTAIEERVDAMLRLIDQLVDTARLEPGQELQLHLSEVNLVELVARLVQQYGETTRHHQLRLQSLGCETLVGVWDADRLAQVIDNLLSNAIKYSADGSIITISMTRQEDLDPLSSWAVLTVRDEGVGIPATDLPQLFQRFYRGSNVVGLIPGTGLGLTSARDIIEAHGGTIGVESTEEVGTTVTVRLPLPLS